MKKIILTLLLIMLAAPSAYAQKRISRIEVIGAQRIEPATVTSYLDIGVGDEITRESMDRSLKNLFSTGLFVDVTLRQQDTVLKVEVIENPIINQIAFEGNDEISDQELQAEIQSRIRQVFTRTKVQSDVARLYQVYRRNGRFSVKIDPKIIQLDQNRVNLVFEIQEGGETHVEKITFIGNTRFDDDALRSEITTKEDRWYRFLSDADRYDPDRLAFDEQVLRRFYLKNGYADFRVISSNAELSNDQKNFFITFTVEEGERYKVGDITINSKIRDFDPAPLREVIEVKKGEWYDASLVQDDVDELTEALGNLQYPFVSVKPDMDRNRESKVINLTYDVEETPRVFVDRINVNGNVRTMDKVLRREMLLAEGDPFNRNRLEKSERNLRDLDFFENIAVEVSPGSAPDKSNIDINVQEKSTGELSVGAGFSTFDGPLADLRLTERNLLGKGQELSLSSVIAGRRTEFDLSFTEPYFLGRDVSAGFDLFHITRDFQSERSFDQRRTGGGVRLGYPLSSKWRQNFGYRYELNEITDVDADASRFIRDQSGERKTSAINQRLTYDDRDSVLFPTEGLFYWLDTEFAGIGGDAEYISAKTGASYFHPFTKSVIFNLLGEVGAIDSYSDQEVKINERYFIGGNSFRGFERSGIGPRDTTTGDALGGNMFYRGTAEFTFPVGLPEELGVSGHAFNDIGSLWGIDSSGGGIVDESSLRASAGVGISWRSPFGPIRIDFAAPYLKEDHDQDQVVRINFGTRF